MMSKGLAIAVILAIGVVGLVAYETQKEEEPLYLRIAHANKLDPDCYRQLVVQSYDPEEPERAIKELEQRVAAFSKMNEDQVANSLLADRLAERRKAERYCSRMAQCALTPENRLGVFNRCLDTENGD